VDLLRPFFRHRALVALVLMAPLAATSTVGMIRRLGGRAGRRCNRLAYPAAVASVLHTYWPLTLRAPRYALILGIVFVLRVGRATHVGGLLWLEQRRFCQQALDAALRRVP